MIKSQLIAKLSTDLTSLSEKQINDAVNCVLNLMTESLINNQRIEIRGFGSFSLHHRPPRSAHNPKTGEKVVTVEKYTPHFKPGKELRERVNESRNKIKLKKEDKE
jgi:integration host factor subunit beta